MTNYRDKGFQTRAVRAGQRRTGEQEQSEPIFPTSSFVFDNPEQAAARFAGEEPGNIYSRFTNPTVALFEERLAALEGAEAGVGTASGMAAILSLMMSLLEAGDHVVCARQVFGTTATLFNKYLARFGIVTDFVDLTDLDAWGAAIRPETRMLFLESPSNPLTEVADIRALAELARAHDCRLVVDNCFCTPALQRPLELGADLVVHSATKYLDGQGRCVGGAVVGDAATMAEVRGFLRTAGPSMSPFNAWVFAKGLETLGLRMEAHSRHARAVAQWLDDQPGVEQVHYPGLPEHPQHALAGRQQSAYGGIVSFRVAGGEAAAWRLLEGLEWLSLTANLGDAKTTITHPATTTHGRLSAEQRREAGIDAGLIRMAVGLESVSDILDDLGRGLERL